jgi:hypothetical protein
MENESCHFSDNLYSWEGSYCVCDIPGLETGFLTKPLLFSLTNWFLNNQLIDAVLELATGRDDAQ